MLFAGTKRTASVLVISLALVWGCSMRTLSPHDVETQAEPQSAYATVLEVAAAEEYKVVTKDDAAKKVRLQSQADSGSYIDVEVAAGQVKLTPGGKMVSGAKLHRKLNNELEDLQGALKKRFHQDAEPAGSAVAVASASATPTADTSGAPAAWSEPAYDPSVWGNGNFTCLPVRVPVDHQQALTLQLTNGEKADLQLSLAYDQGLCRSPGQCKQPGGCPALGIGDSERVSRLAGRLSRGEIGSQATLLDSGKVIATIDLAHHGSIVQALSDIKH
jgi:hypothetical protein